VASTRENHCPKGGPRNITCVGHCSLRCLAEKLILVFFFSGVFRAAGKSSLAFDTFVRRRPNERYVESLESLGSSSFMANAQTPTSDLVHRFLSPSISISQKSTATTRAVRGHESLNSRFPASPLPRGPATAILPDCDHERSKPKRPTRSSAEVPRLVAWTRLLMIRDKDDPDVEEAGTDDSDTDEFGRHRFPLDSSHHSFRGQRASFQRPVRRPSQTGFKPRPRRRIDHPF